MYKVLIVEDEPAIAQMLEEGLKSWGYEAKHVEDLADVMGAFDQFSPHAVLLDIGLPVYNGFHWCSEIRKSSRVPVLFLSSLADNMNMVLALQQGADDFMAKPFDLTVLAAKLGAVLRRTYDFAAPADRLAHRGAVLDVGEMCLRAGDEKVLLTANEFRILQMLMEQKGHVVSRDALMRRLWESEAFVDDNTLTVNVTRLRKKLDEAGLAGFISTKKGAGYCIEEE